MELDTTMALDPSAIETNGSAPKWAAILGRWNLNDASQVFLGSGQEFRAAGQVFPVGLAISNATLQNGVCRAEVRFSSPFGEDNQGGGIVLGYRSPEQHYVVAQLGTGNAAYSIGEYISGFGWRPLVVAGQRDNLESDRG